MLAFAHRQFLEQLPNAALFTPVWKALGHIAPMPQRTSSPVSMPVANVRFARNPFGTDFAAAGFVWSERLCRLDSDGDGRSNGEELGDPLCLWRHGDDTPAQVNASLLSHPGVAGERGEWVNMLAHARALGCVPKMGCERLGVRGSKMDVRFLAPAAEVAMYHYAIVPLLLLLGLSLYLCTPHAPHPRVPLILLETYLVCHVGVFIGCHRWAAHHAFAPSTPLKWLLSFFAAWCMQGTPVHWAFLHRLHHRFCDQGDLDLQAPRPPHPLLYGHVLWFSTPVDHFYMSSAANGEAIVYDLLHDNTLPPFGKRIDASIACHAATVTAIAAAYAMWDVARSTGVTCCRSVLQTALKTYVFACWYFWLPCALAFQCVLLVIDAVHMWGDLAFEDAMSAPCEAKNNAFLILPLLGENWHNNHHSTPHSASTWVWWYQLDLQYLLIRLFELVGLASDVVVAMPTKLREDYDASGLLMHVAAEWIMLAALVSAPWWSGYFTGLLKMRGCLNLRLKRTPHLEDLDGKGWDDLPLLDEKCDGRVVGAAN
ncbi:MAG: hypothetical protein SGPRY_003834 [Prymnesium sp.]